MTRAVRSWFRSRSQDESGATLVVVGVSLLVLVGATALAVDAGALWFTRRNVIVDTDAAALGAALHQQDRVLSGLDCEQASAESRAADVIADNDEYTDLDALALFCQGRYGKVTVDASRLQPHFFAGIFPGAGADTDIVARAVAEFGPAVGTDQLRPLPLCVGGGSEVTPYYIWQQGLAVPPLFDGGLSASGQVFRIVIDNDTWGDVCNPNGLSTPGNFRWVDFDGNNNPAFNDCVDEGISGNELVDRFQGDGYPCLVFAEPHPQGANCVPDDSGFTNDPCPTSTGNVTSVINCLQGTGHCDSPICPLLTPAADCDPKWTLLLYDELVEQPGWPNVATPALNPVGFVQVVPRGAGSLLSRNYIDIEFMANTTGSGVIGGPSTPTTHLHHNTVRMCGAEPDENSCKG